MKYLKQLYQMLIRGGHYLIPGVLLLIRLACGWELFESGRAHLDNVPTMVERFHQWGIPWPHLNVYISGYTEMIGGLLRVHAGSLRIYGRDVAEIPRRQMARLVATVPQDLVIPFSFTVREMVELGRTAYVGVMAQEVQSVTPEAVTRGADGYLSVSYDLLGLPFETYDQWVATGAHLPSVKPIAQ